MQGLGGGAFGAAGGLLGLNGLEGQDAAFENFRKNAGYDHVLSEGLKSVTGNSAVGGSLQSGATMKALQDRGAQIANMSMGDYLNRLMSMGGAGLQATGQVGSAMGAAGQAAGSNLMQQSANNQGFLGGLLGF